MSRDYIPAQDADFDDFFKFMNQYVAQKCGGQTPEWTHIPQAARTTMVDTYVIWYTAYGKTFGPHTPEDTSAKNDAKDASRKVIRPFVNQYLRYPPVTKQDREAMGIPNRDEKPTPIPRRNFRWRRIWFSPAYTWWSWSISGRWVSPRRTPAATTGCGSTTA